MKRIRIGQIGIGHEHASEKMAALRRLADRYEVVGVVDDRGSSAARFPSGDMKPYEGVPWMTEEELFAVPGLRAVAVETANTDVVPAAVRCMERGLHMHADKPGGEVLEPFRGLIEGCERRGLAIQMGYMYRTNPAVKLCFRAVREGWLGDVFEIHTVMSRFDGEAYRAYLARFKGGAMFNFGCHLLDLVVAMMGRPERVVPFQTSTRGDGLNDSGLAVLAYPRATATVRSAVVEVDGMNHRRLIVCGTKGSVEICPLEYPGRYREESLHARLTLLEGNAVYPAGTHMVDVGAMNGRYDDQLIELADVIDGKMPNPFGYGHELLVQEVLLAAAGYTAWKP